MDFNQILQWLQSMTSTNQAQNTNQYTSALGLGQQELGQQASQFSQSLDLQKLTQQQANDLANAQLGLQTTTQQEANALAQAQQGQSSQQQNWEQGQEASQNAANTAATNQRNAQIQAILNSPWMSNPNSGQGQSLLQQLAMLTGGNYGNTLSSVSTK